MIYIVLLSTFTVKKTAFENFRNLPKFPQLISGELVGSTFNFCPGSKSTTNSGYIVDAQFTLSLYQWASLFA